MTLGAVSQCFWQAPATAISLGPCWHAFRRSMYVRSRGRAGRPDVLNRDPHAGLAALRGSIVQSSLRPKSPRQANRSDNSGRRPAPVAGRGAAAASRIAAALRRRHGAAASSPPLAPGARWRLPPLNDVRTRRRLPVIETDVDADPIDEGGLPSERRPPSLWQRKYLPSNLAPNRFASLRWKSSVSIFLVYCSCRRGRKCVNWFPCIPALPW